MRGKIESSESVSKTVCIDMLKTKKEQIKKGIKQL